MKKLEFKTSLQKFGQMGEKSGWIYIAIPASLAHSLAPGIKKSFRVKGKIDDMDFRQKSLLPMGDGNFILPVNGPMRKMLNKKNGESVNVVLQHDKEELKIDQQLLDCLADEPEAFKNFKAMPLSHQKYYSNWIVSAKTEPTKIKRIALAVNTLAQKMNYSEMIRSRKNV